MPELPEVEVVRRGLETHLLGRRIEMVQVLHSRPVSPSIKLNFAHCSAVTKLCTSSKLC